MHSHKVMGMDGRRELNPLTLVSEAARPRGRDCANILLMDSGE
jgi:hypothetical protein